MGIIGWLFRFKIPRKKYHGKPISRIGGRTYWKGMPIDDDIFQSDNKAIREYNSYLRRHYIRKGNKYFNKRYFSRHRRNRRK